MKRQIWHIPDVPHFPVQPGKDLTNSQPYGFYDNLFITSNWRLPTTDRVTPYRMGPHCVFVDQITSGVYRLELLNGVESQSCVMKVTAIDTELFQCLQNDSQRYGERHRCTVLPGAWVEVAGWAKVNHELLISSVNLRIGEQKYVVLVIKELHNTWHSTMSRYVQYEPSPNPLLTYADVVLASLAQIYLYTLGMAHYTHKICHNDLKTDNLMYYKTSLFGYVFVQYKGVTLRIPTYGRRFVLIDMAFASIKYDVGSVCSITPLVNVEPKFKFQAFQPGTDFYQISSCMQYFFGESMYELSFTNPRWEHVLDVLRIFVPHAEPKRTDELMYVTASHKSFPQFWEIFTPYFQFDDQVPGDHTVLVFE